MEKKRLGVDLFLLIGLFAFDGPLRREYTLLMKLSKPQD